MSSRIVHRFADTLARRPASDGHWHCRLRKQPPLDYRSAEAGFARYNLGRLLREQRRLAAILAADVLGYSRLMGHDETGTLTRLREHRRRRFEPIITAHVNASANLATDCRPSCWPHVDRSEENERYVRVQAAYIRIRR